jgi:galactosamine-6-phosphate isomerase
MNGNDEGSCRFHLNNQLFNPLHISENNICFFDGKTKDLNAECDKVENFITQHGGIDVAIVGLGMNGHVGMNEPGTSSSLRSHVTEIDAITQQVGQKYFKEKTHISKGITLGIANIMEARNVILIVSGNKKAEILRRVLEEEISEQLPASLLRNHENFSVYLDAEAANLLQNK